MNHNITMFILQYFSLKKLISSVFNENYALKNNLIDLVLCILYNNLISLCINASFDNNLYAKVSSP